MMFPPSLPEEVHQRAFVGSDGELGILLSDAKAFLDACRRDGVSVYGRELWVVDTTAGRVSPMPLYGDGDADETDRDLAELALSGKIPAAVAPHIRVNFTIST